MIESPARLKRILSLPKVEAAAAYPETPQPQNGLTLIPEETQRGYKPDRVFKYLWDTAQDFN